MAAHGYWRLQDLRHADTRSFRRTARRLGCAANGRAAFSSVCFNLTTTMRCICWMSAPRAETRWESIQPAGADCGGRALPGCRSTSRELSFQRDDLRTQLNILRLRIHDLLA